MKRTKHDFTIFGCSVLAALMTLPLTATAINVDFSSMPVVSYDPSEQDVQSSSFVHPDNSSIHMFGNTWKAIDLGSYTLTSDTVLKFDFLSDSGEPEICAIGFDSNLDYHHTEGGKFFQLYGHDNFSKAKQAHHNYTPSEGFKSYTIRVGDFMTGARKYIVLVCDRDAATPDISVSFSNVQLLEETENLAPMASIQATPPSGMAPLQVQFDGSSSTDDNGVVSYDWDFGDGSPVESGVTVSHTFNDPGSYDVSLTVFDAEGLSSTGFHTLVVSPQQAGGVLTFVQGDVISFGVSEAPPQDEDAASFAVLDGGTTLRLFDNTWKAIPLSYVVTPNTIIEFDFISEGPQHPEINGVGFETQVNSFNKSKTFQIYGSQHISGMIHAQSYNSPGSVQHITLPVGQYFTGAKDYLVFVNDNDAHKNVSVKYSNIMVHEGVTPPPSNEAPLAVAQAAPLSGVAPLDVSFNAGASTDDVGIADYRWDFGNGSQGNGIVTPFLFSTPGTYNVTLTVEDDEGLTGIDSVTINVTAAPTQTLAVTFREFDILSFGTGAVPPQDENPGSFHIE